MIKINMGVLSFVVIQKCMYKHDDITRYLQVLDPALFKLQKVSWYGVFMSLFGFAVTLTRGFTENFFLV